MKEIAWEKSLVGLFSFEQKKMKTVFLFSSSAPVSRFDFVEDPRSIPGVAGKFHHNFTFFLLPFSRKPLSLPPPLSRPRTQRPWCLCATLCSPSWPSSPSLLPAPLRSPTRRRRRRRAPCRPLLPLRPPPREAPSAGARRPRLQRSAEATSSSGAGACRPSKHTEVAAAEAAKVVLRRPLQPRPLGTPPQKLSVDVRRGRHRSQPLVGRRREPRKMKLVSLCFRGLSISEMKKAEVTSLPRRLLSLSLSHSFFLLFFLPALQTF